MGHCVRDFSREVLKLKKQKIRSNIVLQKCGSDNLATKRYEDYFSCFLMAFAHSKSPGKKVLV